MYTLTYIKGRKHSLTYTTNSWIASTSLRGNELHYTFLQKPSKVECVGGSTGIVRLTYLLSDGVYAFCSAGYISYLRIYKGKRKDYHSKQSFKTALKRYVVETFKS